MDEITITLTSLTSQKTESINVSSSSTTTSELCEFAIALLGLPTSADKLILTKDGKRLNTNAQSSNLPLSSLGIKNGDLILVLPSDSGSASGSRRQPTAVPAPPGRISGSSGTGMLDFSSILGNANTSAPPPAPAVAAAASGNNGGLTFNIPTLGGSLFGQQTTPVQWDGMNLDDAVSRNPNPECFVKVLLDEQRHPNLLKEFNFHNPILAKKIKNAGIQMGANIWRQERQRSTMNLTLGKTIEAQKEAEMERKLKDDPMDAEANKYFGDKIQKQNVDEQYRQMMEEFPESMGKVLMLYIEAAVNGHPIQAFVDSGAQSTIMSSKCAEKCGLLHLLDTRFEGTAVGVGTGKILGRIHMAQMKIQDHYFPCTITVMDSEEGLGDKNMDFLLGLDMLKRFKCSIDLGKNALVFIVGSGTLETPFLHEKDLLESKGGTKGFDAEKSNMEVDMMIEQGNKKEGDK